ncbi:hypothetical protein NP233_g2700 [Leucocoprinus birnbaumii]|uniref:Uncharacterized protein n=1 Tax=Leucocoprinus birnbaumii TaxID=56174 RepID=A0AAD5YUM4_9AGAR|nr:hypothetical protein NP233_g2700 [Leucocoprinus birnbaumii]
MPPTLRSAQSSPAGKNAVFDPSPSDTPTRKAPKCTKCGQPRLGHPRSGCPNITSGSEDPDPTGAKPKTLQENLSEAFGSMYLESSNVTPERAGDKERRGRHSIGTPGLQPSDTLASITSSAAEMLQDLTRPGFFSQVSVTESDGDSRLEGSKGQDKTAVPTLTPSKLRLKSGPQILMPGTLKAPSWESSIEGLPEVPDSSGTSKAPLAKTSLGVQTSFRGFDNETAPSPLSNSQSSGASSQTSIPIRPLQRSQTQEERQIFLGSLTKASPASVFIHKKLDVDEVRTSAQAAKLHVRPVYSDDENAEDVLLVIGGDLSSVEKLAEELTKSIKSDPAPHTTNNIYITTPSTEKPPSSSTFKAVASGAIVGVVGTWAGLAFS